MQTKILLKLGTSALLSSALVACSDSPSAPPAPAPVATATPTPSVSTFQSMFGAAFAAIFDAPVTTDPPTDPDDNSVPALAQAADPLDN